jgi:hypothetical protein
MHIPSKRNIYENTECEDITRKIKKVNDTMVTYFLMIDYVLSNDPQVLARVIPTMERAQWLLDTLEVVSDCQPLPVLRVLAIIEPINVVHPGTVSKCNNIKIELTMKEKYCRPINVYKELIFVKFG